MHFAFDTFALRALYCSAKAILVWSNWMLVDNPLICI